MKICFIYQMFELTILSISYEKNIFTKRRISSTLYWL